MSRASDARLISRLRLRIASLERERRDEGPDFITERRVSQEKRNRQVTHRVRSQLDGEWVVTNAPCPCGRPHYAVKSSVENNLLCPAVFWARLAFFCRGEFDRPMTDFVRRI